MRWRDLTLPPHGNTSGLPRRFAAITAPLKAVTLGGAVGLLSGGAVAAMTLLHLVLLPRDTPFELLQQYFVGYSISPAGVVIGGCYGALLGFCAGWLLASVHNIAVRLWLGIVRARASLEKSGFLDGI